MMLSRFALLSFILLHTLLAFQSAMAGKVGALTYFIHDSEVMIVQCDLSAEGEIIIPPEIEGAPVTSIGRTAFSKCNLLTSVSIPGSVTSIGAAAFYGCSSLRNIILPEGITKLESSYSTIVYYSLGQRNLQFQGQLTASSVVIVRPPLVSGETRGIFEDCISLASIAIPSTVTAIEVKAFAGCVSLASVTLPDGLITIGPKAFYECTALTSVTIPNSVTRIEDWSFYSCSSLASVTIPDSVTEIGNWAFSGCNSLASVTIPNSVIDIGGYAFGDCTSLTRIVIPESVTDIGTGAFDGCSAITSVDIPKTITAIEGFADCSSLTHVTIPESVEYIGFNAFARCDSLTSVIIPKHVESIRSQAFVGCFKLDRVFFLGAEAPRLDDHTVFQATSPHLRIFRLANSTGFDAPEWEGLSVSIIPDSPEIYVSQSPGQGLRDNRATRNFGHTRAGTRGQSLVFTVANHGAETLNPYRIVVVGANRKDFRIRSRGDSELRLGDSMTFEVRFRPQDIGERKATLKIRSNDPDESSFEIHMRGFGMN
jgi:BspA type Leucine rich repeat region (6 copies)